MPEQGIQVLQPSITTGIAAGGGVATAAIAGTSLAVPIIGAAIAGVTLAIGLWLNRKGPKQKVATTHIVDQEETFLKQNIQAWNSSNKSSAEQQQAIANFYTVWNEVVANCSDDQYGNPGHACIEDRMPAGMTIMAGGKSYTGNGRFNWFDWYLAPIQNDPNVQSGNAVSSILGGADILGGASSLLNGFGDMGYLLLGLLVLGGGYLFFSSDN